MALVRDSLTAGATTRVPATSRRYAAAAAEPGAGRACCTVPARTPACAAPWHRLRAWNHNPACTAANTSSNAAGNRIATSTLTDPRSRPVDGAPGADGGPANGHRRQGVGGVGAGRCSSVWGYLMLAECEVIALTMTTPSAIAAALMTAVMMACSRVSAPRSRDWPRRVAISLLRVVAARAASHTVTVSRTVATWRASGA